jgi:hypothetical protein
MFPRFAAAVAFVAMTALPQVAAAQEPASAEPKTPSLAASVAANNIQFVDDQAAGQIARELRGNRDWTTPVLLSLHAATVATQMLDVHSTMRAIKVGGVEANPVMGGLVNNRAAFIGVKAGISAGVIFVTQKVARDNKIAAIVASAAINSAFVMVARHNYRVAQGLR